MTNKHYKSVFTNEQELLKAIIDVHLKGEDIQLDPMYFKGTFYKDCVNQPKYCFDINPDVCVDNVIYADARNLSFFEGNRGEKQNE